LVRASYVNSNIYPTRCNVTQFIYVWKLLYMIRVVISPIIRRAYNCIYSVWYLSQLYCYLPFLWKSRNWFERAVCGVHHPQPAQTGSNTSTKAADSSNGVKIQDAVDTVVCSPDDGCEFHQDHLEKSPEIDKLCNVAY
jgi:hypothetical protein